MDATGNGKSKATICEDAPLSDAECRLGWAALMAFEHEGSSYQPSASALAHTWTSINAAALAEGLKLDSQFLTDDITRAVTEEGHPPGLAQAILQCLAKDGHEGDGTWSCLDRAKTVEFTGETLLHAKQSNDFLVADFIDTWEDKLPEAWRKDAQLSVIEGAHELPTSTTIRALSTGNTMTRTVSAVASKPCARKWHEKFGKTRKK